VLTFPTRQPTIKSVFQLVSWFSCSDLHDFLTTCTHERVFDWTALTPKIVLNIGIAGREMGGNTVAHPALSKGFSQPSSDVWCLSHLVFTIWLNPTTSPSPPLVLTQNLSNMLVEVISSVENLMTGFEINGLNLTHPWCVALY